MCRWVRGGVPKRVVMRKGRGGRGKKENETAAIWSPNPIGMDSLVYEAGEREKRLETGIEIQGAP